MSAIDHIEKAIHGLRTALGASGEPTGPGSRESKAIWYLMQARDCIADEEPVAVDPTEEALPVTPLISDSGEGDALVKESPKKKPGSGAKGKAFTTATEVDEGATASGS